MIQSIQYFQRLLQVAFSRYFGQKNEPLEPFESTWLKTLLPENTELNFEEQTVLLLALMPHISPQTLDLFFLQNKDLDRPYTELGGWKGVSHGGFLPTGQTANFLIENGEWRMENVNLKSIFNSPFSILNLLSKEHWFYKNNILHLEGQGDGEPFLSGRLVVSEEFLASVQDRPYAPEYNSEFPARRIETALHRNDLVLPYNLHEELDLIHHWLCHQQEINRENNLDRIVKPGYRCLFYGPSGTGKTLTATLLGKENNRDVYRVDLSMIVSKYIGETEKNLAKVFDKAAHQNWILFFDEADALFGQRTETQSSNDRHANQEVAYLLQRIEDFPGMIILATNLKDNIDEAFFRRFQSALYFPMPDQALRYQLWKKMLPAHWLSENASELLNEISTAELSGGSIVNIIQHCAIKMHLQQQEKLSIELIQDAIRREQMKEGRFL